MAARGLPRALRSLDGDHREAGLGRALGIVGTAAGPSTWPSQSGFQAGGGTAGATSTICARTPTHPGG